MKPNQTVEKCRLQKLENRYSTSKTIICFLLGVHFILPLCFYILVSWFIHFFSLWVSICLSYQHCFPMNTCNPFDRKANNKRKCFLFVLRLIDVGSPKTGETPQCLPKFPLPQLFFQFFSTLMSISVPTPFYLVPLYLLQEALCRFLYEENSQLFLQADLCAPWQPAPWILLTGLMNCCVTPPVVMSRQASDASVTLLNIPEMLFRMAHRCKGKNGSGKSQWHFLAAFSADTGSSGGSLLSMLCTQLQYHWDGTGSAEANFP